MFENDNVRIHHILDAAREAVAFSQGRSRADLPGIVVQLEKILAD